MSHLKEVLSSIDAELKAYRSEERPTPPPVEGSRFVGQHASPGVVEHVAAGGRIGEGATLLPNPDQKAAGYQTLGRLGEHGSYGDSFLAAPGAFAKALAESTGTAGGVLLPIEVSHDVALLIRAASVVMQMNPTVVPVAGKELDLPAVASGSTAYYLAENAAIPKSEPSFDIAASLIPRDLAAMVPLSNRLLTDLANNPSIERIVEGDIAQVMALRQDLAFIQGTGSSMEPLGIKNYSGLTAAPSLGANGRTPTFDDLMDTVAALQGVNAPFSRPGWIFSSRTLATIRKLKDGQGRYLADTGLLTFSMSGVGGTLLGYPFRVTNQIPSNLTTGTNTDTSYAIFGSDWGEMFVGVNRDLLIETSAEASYTPDGGATFVSSFQNRQTLIRAVSTHDMALRRPALFTVLSGIRP